MRKLLVTAAALTAVSVSANAADNGIYLGAALSRSTIETDADFFGFSFEDNDTAYKIIGGIRPFDALAFEVNYVDFGNIVFDNRGTVTDGFRGELEAQAIDAFALAFVGGPLIEVFGKIGLIAWDADTVLQGGISGIDVRDDDSGTDLAFGAGVQAQVASLAVRLEYENFDVSEADNVELWSLGVTWTFL